MATMKPTLCGGRAVHAPDCGEDGNCEYYAERAEAWAVGTVGGDPVPSYDLAYENNSKYWAEQSASSASESAESATESTESATQAKRYAETAEQAAEEVTNALGQVMSKTTGIFTQTFTTSTDTATLTFSPTGYTYSANDDFDVYISGLRLNPSEFSWTGSGSSATITLVTPVTHTGTVIEVVANTSSQMTTDATLTIQGAAADAKATGDEINQLKEDLDDFLNVPISYEIADGYYDGNNGNVQNPTGYWQEKRTTKFSVEDVDYVDWHFTCVSQVTQNGLGVAKWDHNGAFLAREVLVQQASYSEQSGRYFIPDNVGTIGFYFSTRGFDVTFTVKATRNLTEQLDGIEEQIDIYNGIIGQNEDATNKILASRWTESATAQPVSLLWFTDPHRQTVPLNRIVEYKDYLESQSALNGAICTGDIVITASDESAIANYWTNNDAVADIMVACGNHDWYAQSSQPHGKMTISQINSIFFSHADEWGVVRSGENPFYYKDYSQGLRLIVVDPAVSDSEVDQTAWLTSVLADAITNNLPVVIALHFLVGVVEVLTNDWVDVAKRGTEINQGYDFTGVNVIQCVSDFINNGGKFICYMCGHTHTDYLAYPKNHTDQLIVSLASASARRYETHLETNDLPRFDGTRTQDCFNVISFDTSRKIIKCVRVGANVNMFEEPRTAFSYNYLTHEFISLI